MSGADADPGNGQPKKKLKLAPQPSPLKANEVMSFHYVSSAEQLPASQGDLAEDEGYPPTFTNQIFEDEEIIGYQGLRIDVCITMDSFVPLLFHKFSSKVSPANDYVSLISKHFTEGLPQTQEEAKSKQATCASLAEVLGSCKTQYTAVVKPRPRAAGEAAPDEFEVAVRHTPIVGAPEPLRQLHARMHPLLLFHVDAASPLQQDDPNMELLLAVRQTSDDAPVEVIGFLTFFKFYAYPTAVRYRVAQILVMPPYQRMGIGRALLETVNQMALANEKCVDVTYEDPAEELQALRERIDAERAVRHDGGSVLRAAQACVRSAIAAAETRGSASSGAAAGPSSSAAAAEDGEDGPSDAVVQALQPPAAVRAVLRKQLKIAAGQANLVWDILLWAGALREKVCSQDAIAELLQGRVMHRELVEVAENLAKAPEAGSEIPENKVMLDAGDLELMGEPEAVAGEAEEDVAPRACRLELLMYRKDRRSRESRRRDPSGPPAIELNSLNEAALESIQDLAHERIEAVESVYHGMRWPENK
eukprot:jgi/Ulvmu1/11675/UM008_0084.1